MIEEAGIMMNEVLIRETVVEIAIWNPQGSRLAVLLTDTELIEQASINNRVMIYDSAGISLNTIHDVDAINVTWKPDSTEILVGCFKNQARRYDIQTGVTIGSLHPHAIGILTDVLCVAWDNSGTRIATGGSDNTIRIWEAATHTPLLTVDLGKEEMPYTKAVYNVGWSPDGHYFAAANWDKNLYVWDGDFRDDPRIFPDLSGFQWCPDSQRIITFHKGQHAVVDLSTGERILTVSHSNKQMTPITWSPDGSKFAGGYAPGEIQIWDAATGETLNIVAVNAPLIALAWPDASTLRYATTFIAFDGVRRRPEDERLGIAIHSLPLGGVTTP